MYIPAQSTCAEGEGELVVSIRTDSESRDDYNYWYLDKRNSAGFYREVESVTLDSPNTNYLDIVCLESGEYFWGIYDCGGDGLGSSGTLSVSLDGTEIVQDQDFDNSLSLAFVYPNLCIDLPGLHEFVRPDDGRLESFECSELEARCAIDGKTRKCKRYCNVSLITGDLVSDVCPDTCATVGQGPCA